MQVRDTFRPGRQIRFSDTIAASTLQTSAQPFHKEWAALTKLPANRDEVLVSCVHICCGRTLVIEDQQVFQHLGVREGSRPAISSEDGLI